MPFIQDENQSPKEKNEDDMQDTEIGDAHKEVEQELPVLHPTGHLAPVSPAPHHFPLRLARRRTDASASHQEPNPTDACVNLRRLLVFPP
jgi:hypothetical protein